MRQSHGERVDTTSRLTVGLQSAIEKSNQAIRTAMPRASRIWACEEKGDVWSGAGNVNVVPDDQLI